MNNHLSVSQLYTPNRVINDAVIAWDTSGKITFSGPASAWGQADSVPQKTGLIAAPGLVNIHTHGGFGVTFGLGDLESELEKYSRWAAKNGTTRFIITITGPDHEFILKTIASYVPLLEQNFPGTQPVGLHLEGPYLNPEKRGAFNPDWIRKPLLEDMRAWVEAGDGWVKHVTLAPELAGADEIARYLSQNGVKAALGHSNTDYETARSALENNFTHITHTYNAQSTMHHRAPNVVGAILSSDRCTAELIADPDHVHPAAMKILIRCLGADRVVIVTDAMPGAGLPDGEYELLGRKAVVKNGRAAYADGTLAGSTATMDAAIRTVHHLAGAPLADTLKMATLNPARVVGIDKECGALAVGKDADIVLLTDDLDVVRTYHKGKLIYEAGGS